MRGFILYFVNDNFIVDSVVVVVVVVEMKQMILIGFQFMMYGAKIYFYKIINFAEISDFANIFNKLLTFYFLNVYNIADFVNEYQKLAEFQFFF